jgi:hypothetical protein
MSVDLIAAALILALPPSSCSGTCWSSPPCTNVCERIMSAAIPTRAAARPTKASSAARAQQMAAKPSSRSMPMLLGLVCVQDPPVPAKAGAQDCGPRRSERSPP